MSFSQQAGALTIAQRDLQGRNAAILALLVARAFGMTINPADLTGSFGAFLRLVVDAIFAARRRSSTIAGDYLLRYRSVELSALEVAGFIDSAWRNESFAVSAADELVLRQLETSLAVTGLQGYREALLTHPTEERALEVAKVKVTSAAVRHALNGGRTAIINTTRSDARILGYARVLKTDNPCYFCAMLASRGPVYWDGSFDESDPRFVGAGEIKVHDNCGCTMEPVYDRRADWPGDGKALSDLWQQSTRGHSGADAIRAFRRAYDRLRDDDAA